MWRRWGRRERPKPGRSQISHSGQDFYQARATTTESSPRYYTRYYTSLLTMSERIAAVSTRTQEEEVHRAVEKIDRF